jgi:hypothetical protein
MTLVPGTQPRSPSRCTNAARRERSTVSEFAPRGSRLSAASPAAALAQQAPRDRRSAKKRDELTPSNADCHLIRPQWIMPAVTREKTITPQIGGLVQRS